jgi:hypothetical protein
LHFPHYFENNHDLNLITYHGFTTTMATEPVECVRTLHDSLLNYAKTFERFLPYRTVMGWTPLEIKTARQRLIDHEMYNDGEEDIPELQGLDLYNPFVGYGEENAKDHPVEGGLIESRQFADKNSVWHVKEIRAQVIGYLEPAYQRISLAAANIKEFRSRFPDEYLALNDNREKRFMALRLLEQYKNAFARDVPKHVTERIEQYGHQKLADQSWGDVNVIVDRALMTLKTSHGESKPCWEEFLRLFNQAITLLDENFSAIRKARLSLFDGDVTDRRCDIDLDLNRPCADGTEEYIHRLRRAGSTNKNSRESLARAGLGNGASVTPTEVFDVWISQPAFGVCGPAMTTSDVKSQLEHLKCLSGSTVTIPKLDSHTSQSSTSGSTLTVSALGLGLGQPSSLSNSMTSVSALVPKEEPQRRRRRDTGWVTIGRYWEKKIHEGFEKKLVALKDGEGEKEKLAAKEDED